MKKSKVAVYLGEALAAYGFGHGHPFGPDRQAAFEEQFNTLGLNQKVRILSPRQAKEEELLRYQTTNYIQQVKKQSVRGEGYLDSADTPAFKGVFEAAATVVGTVLDAADRILKQELLRAFVPIAGLHHARRDTAAGFCVFNDCGVVIETLKQQGIERICYVDIDAHHGDGVYYDFEADPSVIFVDFHEDGHYLYPGTGSSDEIGKGMAAGLKLNIPMPPDATDALFHQRWPLAVEFIKKQKPQFFLLQCGADSVSGDPITHLRYSAELHGFVAKSLCGLADEYCGGKLLALGGGGYNRTNLANAWCEVVKALL